MAGRKIRDEHEARALLAELENSGVAPASFARAHGVDGRSLNAWRLNLERRAPATTMELRVVELVAAPHRGTPPRTVTVRCGPFSLDVDADTDDDLLARVLAVVAAC